MLYSSPDPSVKRKKNIICQSRRPIIHDTLFSLAHFQGNQSVGRQRNESSCYWWPTWYYLPKVAISALSQSMLRAMAAAKMLKDDTLTTIKRLLHKEQPRERKVQLYTDWRMQILKAAINKEHKISSIVGQAGGRSEKVYCLRPNWRQGRQRERQLKIKSKEGDGQTDRQQ